MHQLTSVDAQFLAAEDGRTHGHVSALGIYDPATAPGGALTLEAVRDVVAERIARLAPFRWRLAPVPFNIDHPYWFEDPDFDLDFHLRELALPAPGDDRQLAEQVARLHARPLDRGRPLWELYLIQGLAGGRVAVLTKVHHAAVDGVSGGELLSVLLDPDPTGATFEPVNETRHGEAVPGQVGLLLRGLFGVARQPLRALAGAPRALPHLDLVPTVRMLPGIGQLAAATGRVTRVRGGDGGVLERTTLRAPRTHFNRRIGPHRRFAFASLPLADVKAVKNALGVTVNDVVLALSAGALRRWLAANDDLPTDPLLAMVPVSVRTPEEAGTFGNRVSTMIVPLPTDEPDARQRVVRVNDVMRSAKNRHHATPATLMQDANHFIPPALLARASRVVGQLAIRDPLAPPINVVISNVPGSPAPQFLAGAQLQAQYPVSMIMDGVGLNLTVLSYRDTLDIGVVGDRDLVADAWSLIEHLEAELAELHSLVAPTTPSTEAK
ncbi:WS/DGAT/MGAT family O-acyltransferase [Mycobacterium hubeiense]|uniref:WS/DGAT/MGAT family O-acyltransferase n=1 Tax=Mycobacterium hubeiense TaxID=1867256 RepID=UPI000C7E90BB|nr:wax ester/triacylglycerol synthase family O-acyltransferase [Mycobacterium sp. QGD 101]